MFLQDFNLAWLQLTYATAFFLLLAARSWSVISLDTMRRGSESGGDARSKVAAGL